MKTLERDGKTYRVPSSLSGFQKQLYIHLIDWKRAHIIEDAGTARGFVYDAILPEGMGKELPHVFHKVRAVLTQHQARFPFRLHQYSDHMASSQVAIINLFLPILYHEQANAILRTLKPDFARLATDHLDHGYRLEFWDDSCSGLCDRSGTTGTDADLAIAYYDQEGALCLWLIEHKLTENGFTPCGGFRSTGREARHDCGKSFAELAEEPSSCYYHDAKKYKYWELTATHKGFFANAATEAPCPFSGGMNQLWRNQLMALAIEHDDSQPYKRVTFSVVHHPRNLALQKTLDRYKGIIDNNAQFSVFTSGKVIAAAAVHADAELQEWIDWYKELYDI